MFPDNGWKYLIIRWFSVRCDPDGFVQRFQLGFERLGGTKFD